MQIHIALIPCVGAGGGGSSGGGRTAKCKRFPQKICQDPPTPPHIFICKSSLVEIKEFRLDLCQAMRASSCEMQISFASELCQLQTTPGVTKKVWIP